MKRRVLLLCFVFCLLSSSFLFADLPSQAYTTTQASADKSRFVIRPAALITVTTGENIELSIFDNQTQQNVDPDTINWKIDGKVVGSIGPESGVLKLPAGAVKATTYTAPAKAPAKNKVALEASVAGADDVIAGTIAVADGPNWFLVEGDTQIGPQKANLYFDNKSFHQAGPFGDRFVVMLSSNLVGARGQAQMNLVMGGATGPGTYSWSTSKDAMVTAAVAYTGEKAAVGSINLDSNRQPFSLVGSTTVEKPGAKDPAGFVRGFFGGMMCWEQMVNARTFKSHYVTVMGHFAMPKSVPKAGAGAQ